MTTGAVILVDLEDVVLVVLDRVVRLLLVLT